MGRNFRISEKKLKEIKNKTNKIKDFLEEESEKLKIAKKDLKNEKRFDNVIENVEKVSSKIISEIEDVERKLESKIFIGIIGHYSHGKSSLINCLFSKSGLNEEPLLPIGENIVTSLPTRIDFVNSEEDKYFIGSKEIIASEYKDIVKKGGGNKQLSGNWIIEKTIGEDSFLKKFYEKKISIIDTPGLGGPYYNDTYTTKKLVQQFSLIIVTIKAIDINNEVALRVKPFLNEYNGYKIIVVTFWDKWRESELYEGIENEDQAFQKCRDLIEEKFEMDEETVNNHIIFVSSKNYINGVVPDAESKLSKEWNIDLFKSSLIDKIGDHEDIITKVKSISPVEEKKMLSIKREISDLKKNIENFQEEIKEIEKDMAKTEKHNDYKRLFEGLIEEFEEKIERAIERIADKIETKVEREKDRYLDWDTADKGTISELNEKISEIYERALEDLETKVKGIIEDSIYDELEEYLEDKLKVKDVDHILKRIKKIDVEIDLEKVKGKNFRGKALYKRSSLLNKIFNNKSLKEEYKKELKKWLEDHESRSIERRLKDSIDRFEKDELKENMEKVEEQIEKIIDKDSGMREKIERFLNSLEDKIEDLIDEDF